MDSGKVAGEGDAMAMDLDRADGDMHNDETLPPMKKVRGDLPTPAEVAAEAIAVVEGAVAKKKAKRKPAAAGKAVSRKRTVMGGDNGQNVSKEEDDDEEEGAGEGEGDNDSKHYCICRSLFDEERMMIACDRCDEWYHAVCMNVNEDLAELVGVFICPPCEPETKQRTTWKPKCRRTGCNHAALQPLSRYCSERCGVMAAGERINGLRAKLGQAGTKRTAQYDKIFAERLLGDARLQRAQKREGLVLWDEGSGNDRSAWMKNVLGDARLDTLRGLMATVMADLALDQADFAELIPQLEDVCTTEDELSDVRQQRVTVNAKLDLLAVRTKLLHLAEDRSALLEPVRTDDGIEGASSTKAAKKSKSKKNAGEGTSETSSRAQPRCGYDERLHWDDERLSSWSTGETGKAMLNEETPLDGRLTDGDGDTDSADTASQPLICGLSKRKCKRHADWSLARGYDVDLDRESQMRLLERLSNEAQDLEARLVSMRKQIKASYLEEKQRRKLADEALARALTAEGSRRAHTLHAVS